MLAIGRTSAVGLAMLCMVELTVGVNQSSAEVSRPIAITLTDPALAHYNPQSHVSGTFKVQGSETMYPLLNRLNMGFQRRQPKVAVEVKGGGSAKPLRNSFSLL